MVETRVTQRALVVELLGERVVSHPRNDHVEGRFQPFIERVDRRGTVVMGQQPAGHGECQQHHEQHRQQQT